jgi:SAM-dependent methyltransferase
MKSSRPFLRSGSSAMLLPESEFDGGFDPGFYAELYDAEDRHFWFRARNHIIEIVARSLIGDCKGQCRILEIGCGDGNTTRCLQRACKGATVIGMDLFAEGLRYARARGVRQVLQADAKRPPFCVRFRVIGMFDVLEHIPEDDGFLSELYPLLQDDGRLILTVPAHQRLWSYFDQASHHCRRYAIGELCQKLERCGYAIEYATEFMMGLYPLVWLRRLWWRRADAGSISVTEIGKRELRVNPVLNLGLRAVLAIEAPLIRRRWRMPIGSSILVIATRRVERSC